MAVHGSLAGHEEPVVGLGVVARHALLVALTVVDVHVQHPGIDQRLEVAHRVVAVQHDLGIELALQERELRERRRQPTGSCVSSRQAAAASGSRVTTPTGWAWWSASRTGSHWASW